MKDFFSRLKKQFTGDSESEEDRVAEEGEEEYVEIDTERGEEVRSKIIVRPFVIKDFEDIKEILDSLREGNTIGLINIKPLKDKDLVELKRAINKLKKTTDAIEGEIAGFGDDYIVVTPSFAEIYRTKDTSTIKKEETTIQEEDI
jgi:SepF-like predicted cell division protein (DUF552 family)